MKQFAILLIMLPLTFYASANNNKSQLLQKLSIVNAEWPRQPESMQALAAANIGNPANYTEWIATHLMLVEKILRNRNVSYLNAEQKSNRTYLLDELHDYWQAGIFPQNTYTNYKTPVFIDAVGTHCAVGYLMQQSGSDELAQRINRNEKFAYVHQIKTDGVKQWADKNGFTIDELAWIQPSYVPQNKTDSMNGGVNDAVNTMVIDNNTQTIYIGGNFTGTNDGVTCNHLAAWISGFAGYSWISVGNGVDGNVHTMAIHNNKLYVGGEFTMASGIPAAHIAVYDIALGQWQAIGNGLDSTVRALIFYNDELYAGGDFNGGFSKWNGTNWEGKSAGLIIGSVRTLEVWNNEIAIGGNFDIATGAPRKNALAYDGNNIITLGFGVPTTVNTLISFRDTLYAGCDAIYGADTCSISYYNENANEWITLAKSKDYYNYWIKSIRKLIPYDNTHLLVLGDFSCNNFSRMGSNIALAEITSQPDNINWYPLTALDSVANTGIVAINGDICFGGKFRRVSDIPPNGVRNYIAYWHQEPNAIKVIDNAVTINLFPNPATDAVYITTTDKTDLQRIDVYDVTGKMVLSQNMASSTATLSLGGIAPGLYTVRTLTNNGWGAAKLVKQ